MAARSKRRKLSAIVMVPTKDSQAPVVEFWHLFQGPEHTQAVLLESLPQSQLYLCNAEHTWDGEWWSP